MRIAAVLNEDLKDEAAAAAASLLCARFKAAKLAVEVFGGKFVVVSAPSDSVLGARADGVGLLKARARDGKNQEFDFAAAAAFKGWGQPGFFLPCEAGELLMGIVTHIKEPVTQGKAGSLSRVLELSGASKDIKRKANALAESSLTRALEVAQVISFVTPLHDDGPKSSSGGGGGKSSSRADVWKALFKTPLAPVAEVHAYFGAKVAMYFAWMNFFTCWLLGLGVIGVGLYVHRVVNNYTVANHPWLPFFSLAAAVWGVCFLVAWRLAEARHACAWGGLGSESVESDETEVRPEFHGALVTSPVTGKPSLHYPAWRRVPCYTLSAVASGLILAVAAALIVCSLNFQGYIQDVDLWTEKVVHIPSIAKWAAPGALFDPDGNLFLVPTVVHVLVLMQVNGFYRVVAHWLTELENHAHEQSFEDALIVKRFCFEAFDCYIPLVYLAFVQFDIVRVRVELVSIYTADSARRVFTEAVLPWLTHKASEASKKKARAAEAAKAKKTDKLQQEEGGGSSQLVALDALQDELDKEEYEAFDDYLEMVIEFGYVTLFAAAFPLAAALSVLCNVVEIKSDCVKLLYVTRRPPPKRTAGIGTWGKVLRVMVYLSIVTNLALFAFSSDQMAVWLPGLFGKGGSGSGGGGSVFGFGGEDTPRLSWVIDAVTEAVVEVASDAAELAEELGEGVGLLTPDDHNDDESGGGSGIVGGGSGGGGGGSGIGGGSSSSSSSSSGGGGGGDEMGSSLGGRFGILVVVVLLEHLCVLAGLVFESVAPSVPEDVSNELKRLAYEKNLAAKAALERAAHGPASAGEGGAGKSANATKNKKGAAPSVVTPGV